jgi:recombinational DNA repair protein RecT
MARKTVLRRLAKRLPISDEAVQETIAHDDELYDLKGSAGSAPPLDMRPEPEKIETERPRSLQAVVEQSKAETAPVQQAGGAGPLDLIDDSEPPMTAGEEI